MLEDDKKRLHSKGTVDFEVDVNSVRKVTRKGYTSYTFYIKRHNAPKNITENLVLENKNDTIKGYLMKYKDAYYEENDGMLSLKTKMLKTPYQDNLTALLSSLNINFQQKFAPDCYTDGFHSVRVCSVHGAFSTNPNCNNFKNDTYWDYNEKEICLRNDDGYADLSSDGGGGGSSGSGGSSTSPIIPCLDIIHGCDKEPHLELADELEITDKSQIDYLEENFDDINTFREKNNYSIESETYVKELIKSKINNNFSNLFSLSVFNQNPYNVWKVLSQAEKDLIKQNWSEAYHIFKNREIATNATVTKFGKNGLNDKSDAFRHAYYNIINTKVVGIGMAKLFSDAHESETPSALVKEKEMDLFNNNIGQQSLLGNSSLSLSQLVNVIYQKVLNGDLRYLSPLDKVASKNYDLNRDGIQDCSTCANGIISTTKLTPTNQ